MSASAAVVAGRRRREAAAGGRWGGGGGGGFVDILYIYGVPSCLRYIPIKVIGIVAFDYYSLFLCF